MDQELFDIIRSKNLIFTYFFYIKLRYFKMEIQLNGTEELNNEIIDNQYNFTVDIEKNEWVKNIRENSDLN